MQKIKIYTDKDDYFIPTHVDIDGVRLKNVTGIAYEQYPGEVPQCTIETMALPDITTLADIKFQFTPQTIEEAATVLRHNLLSNKEFYNAYIASIKSTLKELPEESDIDDVAKVIMDRIIGEE